MLYDAGRCRRCTRQTAKRGEATEYRAVDADGRTLLGYSISASGAATPMAAGGYLPAADCAGASPMPAYAADSHASPQMVALNVCSVSESGDISEPRVVYLIDGERFDERFVSVTVTEGWLSPAVWLDARPPAQGRSWDCLGEIAEVANTAGIRPLPQQLAVLHAQRRAVRKRLADKLLRGRRRDDSAVFGFTNEICFLPSL